MARAYIALGANLGNREANIRRALALIQQMGIATVRRVSTLVETEPVGGPPGQETYLNGAAEIETDLSPCELLSKLKSVEVRAGRIERGRWAPREVDLDILLYEGEVVRSPALEIPHPRMCERMFVLKPLAQIAPEAVHPVSGLTVSQLLGKLSGEDARE